MPENETVGAPETESRDGKEYLVPQHHIRSRLQEMNEAHKEMFEKLKQESLAAIQDKQTKYEESPGLPSEKRSC